MEFSSIPGLTAGEEGTRLFKMAMNGKWDDVIDRLTGNPFFLGAGVTRTYDTLLHLAVSEGQEKTVLKMINIIKELPDPKKSVQPRNNQGNTALHLAAMVGNVAMCKCIAEVDPSLIEERNDEGETPLFTAVLFDKKQAFQCLYDLCRSNDKSHRCSRNPRTGDTILHYAISENHFDLALRIIQLYGKVLVNAVNYKKRITALHLLAEKPSAFQSGSLLFHGFCKTIIYNCIFIDEHEVEQNVDHPKEAGKALDQYFPENYKTCIGFFLIFGGFFRSFVLPVLAMIRGKVRELRDEERPETQPEDTELSTRNIGAWKQRFSLAMYGLFNIIFKLANRTIKIVLIALGIPMIRKIYEEKKKHKLSIVIMKKLLTSGKDDMYAYYCGAADPLKRPDKLSTTLDLDEIKGLGDEIGPDDQIGPDHEIIDPDGIFDEDDNVRKGIPMMIRKIYEGKKKHKLSILIMKKLLTSGKDDMYAYYCGPDEIDLDEIDLEEIIGPDVRKGRKGPETPILIAARNGISEIVEKLLEQFPIAIHDVNEDNKNAMLLAVQNRQPHVFQILLKKNILVRDRMLRVVDKSGNNVAHLAAMRGNYRPWQIAGEALQMQYEIKWFKFVRGSNIPSSLLTHRNKHGKTPEELFIEDHKQLVKEGGEWLVKTSESYSLVAALIATVAFATSATVPGGVKDDIGIPTLENRTPFHIFAISSLIALFFSVTALVTFLSILTSRYKPRDFAKDLPMKLLIGLTSLFFSIAAMLISFCSGHLFVIDNKLKYVAYTVYVATCIPVTLFAMMQFPLYFDLIESTFRKVPQRSYMASVF